MRKLALWACLLSASVSYGNEYNIRNGDTVEKIAKKLGVTADSLRKANPGLKEKQLQIGKKLRVPGSSTKSVKSAKAAKQKAAVTRSTTKYKIQSGENNWDLARRYGLKVSELEALNGRDLSKLRPGEEIVVPKRASKAAPISARVATKTESLTKKLSSTHAKVKGDRVTVRKSSSTGSARVASVEEGLLGKIVSQRDGWCKMAFADGTQGWVKASYLAAAKAPKPTKQLVAKKAKPEPKPEPRKPDQVLAVNAASNRTDEVKAEVKRKPEPKPAAKSVAAKRNSPRTSGAVVSAAKSLLGTPYVWGGTSRGGFDCSGFVGYVMRQAGISLPRTSGEQAKKGTYVSRGELRTGDLVFFNTRGSRISHVGMYLDNGKFIHASSGGGRVRIDSLSKSYYATRYVTARRVGKFESVTKAITEVKRQLEESGELPKPADQPEVRVQPGADEVGK